MGNMLMKIGATGTAFGLCALLAGGAMAWQVAGSPDVTQIVTSAKPGTVVTLPAGNYGPLVISGKHFKAPVTVRAAGSTIESIVIRDSSNIVIEGGTVRGGQGVRYAIHVDRARAVTVRGMTVTGAVRGMVINMSQAVGVYQNKFTGLRTDGVNIAESRKVVVEGNSCSNFNPIMPIYSSTGALIKDGDHPDCIQAWSRATSAPVSDVVVRGNSMNGYMQGIFFGNGGTHGGFDRVTIQNNYVNISMPNGIYIADGRGVDIRFNEVRTVSGARLKGGMGSSVKATIKAIRPIATVACTNIVTATPTGYGTGRCS
mgnify:CR=1 FL=1